MGHYDLHLSRRLCMLVPYVINTFVACWFSVRLCSAKELHILINTLIIFVKLLGQYGVLYDSLCVSVTFNGYVKAMNYI